MIKKNQFELFWLFFSQAWKFIPVTKKITITKKEITREIICKKSNVTLFVCMSNRKMNDELWVGSVTKILDKKKSSSPLNFLSSNNSNLLLYYYSVPNLFWLASSSIVQLMPSQRYTLFKIQFSKIDVWFFGKSNFWIVCKKR